MSESIERRALAWLCGDDTGASSKALCRHMLGLPESNVWRSDWSYPSDPSDLGRCLRLLALIPEWDERIGEMAQHGRYWVAIAERWHEVAERMRQEVGIDWSKGRKAPRTYALMQGIFNAILDADPNVVRFGGVTLRTEGATNAP